MAKKWSLESLIMDHCHAERVLPFGTMRSELPDFASFKRITIGAVTKGWCVRHELLDFIPTFVGRPFPTTLTD